MFSFLELAARDIYDFKNLPAAFALLKKEQKNEQEQTASRSFVRYFVLKLVLLFTFVFTSVASLFLHPITLWHLTIGIPVLSWLCYQLLNYAAAKTAGKDWFAWHKSWHKAQVEKLEQSLKNEMQHLENSQKKKPK